MTHEPAYLFGVVDPLEREKRSLNATIFDHGDHCTDSELNDWQRRLEDVERIIKVRDL